MSEQPCPAEILPEDWQATPPAVRAFVQAQAERLTRLEERLATLEERVTQTSRTSSRPPSPDPPSALRRRRRAPSGRPAGRQVGHVGQGRVLLPVEQVDHIIEVKPEASAQCGQALAGADGHPGRHQVADLPQVVPVVTEYRRHTLRDFAAISERGGEPTRIGQALLAVSARIFGQWYRVREGTLSRAAFQTAVEPLRTQVGALLREGATLEHATTRRTCANILKLETALWTFVTTPGVEPTNNAAERALRRAVVWRRRSFGTQSMDGSRFAERLLTVVTTLRQQNGAVLDYLTAACTAVLQGQPAPSLLPPAPAGTDAVCPLSTAA